MSGKDEKETNVVNVLGSNLSDSDNKEYPLDDKRSAVRPTARVTPTSLATHCSPPPNFLFAEERQHS